MERDKVDHELTKKDYFDENLEARNELKKILTNINVWADIYYFNLSLYHILRLSI